MCPAPGEVCKLGTCARPVGPDAGTEEYVTTGGGGGCGAGGGAGLLAGLLGIGLAFRRRRSS
jgi:hypothetical protein